PLSPTLFPYTTLFRSHHGNQRSEGLLAHAEHVVGGVHQDRGRMEIALGLITGGLGLGPNSPALVQSLFQVLLHRAQLAFGGDRRSEEHTSELQSRENL